MAERVRCDICNDICPPHAHYIVKMEVYADPSVPAMTTEELEEAGLAHGIAKLIEQMKHLSADELMDDVHRRMEFRLCRACQRRFLTNPLGLPRTQRPAEN